MWSREYFEAMDEIAGEWWWTFDRLPCDFDWVGFEKQFNELRESRKDEVPRATDQTHCITIPLKKISDCFYGGEVSDLRCLGPSRWIMGIHTSQLVEDIAAVTPRTVRICSQRFVAPLVKRNLPGLALNHLEITPVGVPAKTGFEYFDIRRVGPCWDHILETRQVGVYIPSELPDPIVDILVIFTGRP